MKVITKMSLFLIIAGLSFTSSHAQLKDVLSKGGAAGVNAGSLLKQFSGALNPTSMISSWAGGGKTNWLSAAGKVSDAVSMGKSVAGLAGYIKPIMFKQGFNVSNLIQTANTVKTVSAAGGLLKNLEGGLKPEALTSSWASQRPAWLNAVSLLK
jgi:hypothetical protein